MLKARRRESAEEPQPQRRRFPERREGLPEDPRAFLGSGYIAAALTLQDYLSGHGLVAIVGRAGAGKSTLCLRAANSRWARQWFLQDEDGHPQHRRFLVDLEDA